MYRTGPISCYTASWRGLQFLPRGAQTSLFFAVTHVTVTAFTVGPRYRPALRKGLNNRLRVTSRDKQRRGAPWFKTHEYKCTINVGIYPSGFFYGSPSAASCLSNSLRRRTVTSKFILALPNDKPVYIKATSLPALLAASLALSCAATVNVSKNASLPADRKVIAARKLSLS